MSLQNYKIARWIFWCGIGVVLLAVLFCGLIYYTKLPKTYAVKSDYEKTEVLYYLDTVDYDNGKLNISGWAFIPEESIETFRVHVILYDKEHNTCKKIYTFMQRRSDITEAYDTDSGDGTTTAFDYDSSGFSAYAPLKDDGNVYSVYLLYENNGHEIFVDTGHSFTAGRS